MNSHYSVYNQMNLENLEKKKRVELKEDGQTEM